MLLFVTQVVLLVFLDFAPAVVPLPGSSDPEWRFWEKNGIKYIMSQEKLDREYIFKIFII